MSSLQAFASGVSDDLLDKLYSVPTTTGAPGLSGPIHESTQAVLEVLRHDFKSHAPFINDLNFHKYENFLFLEGSVPGAKHPHSLLSHSSHHVLVVYALGASPELIRDAYYKAQVPKLRPTLASPGPITEESFTEHLGHKKYVLRLLCSDRD